MKLKITNSLVDLIHITEDWISESELSTETCQSGRANLLEYRTKS